MSPNAEYTKRWRAANPEATKRHRQKAQPKWYGKNKHRYKAYRFRNKYGVELSDIDNMMLSQGNKCAACKDPLTKETMKLDHCHTSNKIRGILCNSCNVSLGLMRDNATKIRRLANYIAKFS